VTHGNSKEKYTTLILGAGASEHLGYPLGKGLRDKILDLEASKLSILEKTVWKEDDLQKFQYDLKNSFAISIDSYLASLEEDQQNLGKFLITYVLTQNEKKNVLKPPNDNGWYQVLANYLFDEVGNFRQDRKPLAVITFNYDRSLEAFLNIYHTGVYNHKNRNTIKTLKQSWCEIKKELPIIHVHGMLGSYPKVSYGIKERPEVLSRLSKEIKIIHELKGHFEGFVSKAFKRANDYLLESNKIVFMGFGFHKENIARLNFFNLNNMRYIQEIVCAFGDMTDHEISRMLKDVDNKHLSTAINDAQQKRLARNGKCNLMARQIEIFELTGRSWRY